MAQKHSFRLKTVLIFLLLIFGIMWTCSVSQVNREESNKLPDGHGGEGSRAFFALRSCHQLLMGNSGEFYSPDYLCSNPPLWCNWTIQVNPGRRVVLHLEDLTPDDTCLLKQDQIHVDEPTGHYGGHKVLQKCWQEAKYTSVSNTIHVVVLIGGWPSTPYRGFYGRYKAFGPLVVYDPEERFIDQDGKSWMEAAVTHRPLSPVGFTEFAPVMDSEYMESVLLQQHTPPPANSDQMHDYYDHSSTMSGKLPWELQGNTDPDTAQGTESHPPIFENFSHSLPEPTQGTLRSGRGATQTHLGQSEPAVQSSSSHQQHNRADPLRKPSSHTLIHKNVDPQPKETLTSTVSQETESQSQSEVEASPEQAGNSEFGTKARKALDQHPEGPAEAEQIHSHPCYVEPLSDHRGNANSRNHSKFPHLPGDHLFEVAVEVNFTQDLEEPWDSLARSLLVSVKDLISEKLEIWHTPKLVFSKRIKRLSTGVLYIIWLQMGQGLGGSQVHSAVHAALQGLIATTIGPAANRENAVIVSVSTADVNECGTHLVLCDINADCVNQFGSYSCHCRPGFQDDSRLGSGGTDCMDLKVVGCSSGPSAEARGVYVLFFLLSSLILVLLAAAAVLYHRHHRGAFLVRCHSRSSVSSPDTNNNYHSQDSYASHPDSYLPPPPPPARGPRENWPHQKVHFQALDLPLLHFSSLLPSDSYIEPREGGEM